MHLAILQSILTKMNVVISTITTGEVYTVRIAEQLISSLEQDAQELMASWRSATFSEINELGLRRTINYDVRTLLPVLCDLQRSIGPHGEGPSEYSSIGNDIFKIFCALIDELLLKYELYLESDLLLPVRSIGPRYLANLGKDGPAIKVIVDGRIEKGLATILLKLFQPFCEDRGDALIHFGIFQFMTSLAHQLAAVDQFHTEDLMSDVEMALTELNFNHLGFFAYQRNKILQKIDGLSAEERTAYLNEKKAVIGALRHTPVRPFDPSWPNLNEMLYTWLGELSTSALTIPVSSCAPTGHHKKLKLNIPVSYVACLLQLVYDGDWCRSTTLTQLFQFIAAHFETKRQENLSIKSLNKHYYSVDQQTAARVRGILLHMIGKINSVYFP